MANLTGDCIFNTGSVEVDGVQHTLVWTNTKGRTLHIRKSCVWIGLDIDKKADVYGQLMRTSDGAVINPFCWDRYANPNGVQQQFCDFQGDDFMELPAGDGITFYYYAASADGLLPSHAAFAAWIWYF